MSNSLSIQLIDFLILTALVVIIYKILTELRARKEGLNIFKRGNVPTLPVKNFLLGHLKTIYSPNNLKILGKHHEKLGDTFGTFYGPYPWAFTCDPELLYRLFVVESQKFVNLNDYHLPYTAELSLSLPQLRDDNWRIVRKNLNSTFSMKQMKSDNVIYDVEELADKTIKEVIEAKRVEQLVPDGDDGRIVDVLYLARRFSLSVLYRVAFGGGEQGDLQPEVMDRLFEVIQASSTVASNNLPVYASIVLGDWSKRFFRQLLPFSPVWRSIDAINRLLKETVEKRRNLGSQEARRDRKMIDTILEIVKRHNMGSDVLNANLFLFFLAGYDTTASSIAILLWLLARHPEIQEQLRASVIAAGKESEYLTWCIMESLRLYPSVPTGVGRELSEDYHYKGMTFFKGISVVGSTYTMQRMKKYWGEDADEFRPKRHKDPMKHPFQYLPFGGGPRICIGMNLSLIEIRHKISHIILKYRLVALPTTCERLDFTSPNLFQLIVHGKLELGFVKIQK